MSLGHAYTNYTIHHGVVDNKPIPSELRLSQNISTDASSQIERFEDEIGTFFERLI